MTEQRIEHLENEVKRMSAELSRANDIIKNLNESQTLLMETIIEHIASLEADRDQILRSYDDGMKSIINKYKTE